MRVRSLATLKCLLPVRRGRALLTAGIGIALLSALATWSSPPELHGGTGRPRGRTIPDINRNFYIYICPASSSTPSLRFQGPGTSLWQHRRVRLVPCRFLSNRGWM